MRDVSMRVMDSPDFQDLIAVALVKVYFTDVLNELKIHVKEQGCVKGGLNFLRGGTTYKFSPTKRQDILWTQDNDDHNWMADSMEGPRSIHRLPWARRQTSQFMPSRSQWSLRLMIMEEARRCYIINASYSAISVVVDSGYSPTTDVTAPSGRFLASDAYRMATACATARIPWPWLHSDRTQLLLRGYWVSVGFVSLPSRVSKFCYNTYLRIMNRPPIGSLQFDPVDIPLLYEYDDFKKEMHERGDIMY